MFMDYINANHGKLEHMYKDKIIIFICDRAYHSYDLFHLLDSYGFKYIIRIKNNNLINNKKDTKNKNIIFFRENTRCITYEIPLAIKYTDTVSKKKKLCTLKTTYNIITNLNDTVKFSDNIIEKYIVLDGTLNNFFNSLKKIQS